MAFYTILLAPDLSPADHRRAVRAGPPAVTARAEHDELLTRAGFVDVDETDLTREFLDTTRAWQRHSEDLADGLRVEHGDVIDERLLDRARMIAAIDAGWLRRSLFSARRPG